MNWSGKWKGSGTCTLEMFEGWDVVAGVRGREKGRWQVREEEVGCLFDGWDFVSPLELMGVVMG